MCYFNIIHRNDGCLWTCVSDHSSSKWRNEMLFVTREKDGKVFEKADLFAQMAAQAAIAYWIESFVLNSDEKRRVVVQFERIETNYPVVEHLQHLRIQGLARIEGVAIAFNCLFFVSEFSRGLITFKNLHLSLPGFDASWHSFQFAVVPDIYGWRIAPPPKDRMKDPRPMAEEFRKRLANAA